MAELHGSGPPVSDDTRKIASEGKEVAGPSNSKKLTRASSSGGALIKNKKARGGDFGEALKISAPTNGLLSLAITVTASLLGAVLLRRLLKKMGRGSGAAALLEKNLSLPQPTEKETPQCLSGTRVVCSALFDIEKASSRYTDGAIASCSAESLRRLMDAGATLMGRTTTEELNLGLLGDLEDVTNPAAPECSTSGCSSGPAAVVANGLADIALGVDHLSGLRVQSVLFGLSAFRPTQHQISGRGVAAVTGSLDSVGWLVRDPALHLQIAEVFKLPGAVGNFSNTELLQLVIASEVFDLHGEAGLRLKKIALAAARKWAGADQTASGLLVTYLQKNIPAAKNFVGYDNDADDVMEGIKRAAVILQYYELLQRHGHLLEEADSLKPSVLEQLERAQDVGEEEVKAAEQVAIETNKAMRAILKGAIIILPSLPCAQPPQGSEVEALKKWERETLQLSALATLTGCPQVTLSVSQGKGRPPLGLSLLSLPKTDQRLAQVAAALEPLVNAAATSMHSSPAHATSQANAGSLKPKGKRGGKADKALELDLEKQDVMREAGNSAFKAGNYQEAIEKYTIAIKAGPSSSVLHSNRAQALIKVGRFKEAEQDCSKALQSGPNAKSLLRRGTARAALSDIEGAVQDFKHVLALEPSNRQAKLELQNLKQLSHRGLDEGGLNTMFGFAPGTARSDMSF